MYWESNYPSGIANVSTDDVIDIDEAKFKLESADRGFAKVAREFRGNIKGQYTKGDPGTNLIMAISGSENNPYAFHQQHNTGGTDLYRFYCFLRALIHDLANHFPNKSFCFTMDNLNIHRHPIILRLIHRHSIELYLELLIGLATEPLSMFSTQFIHFLRLIMVDTWRM
jgi:hypothetical protein